MNPSTGVRKTRQENTTETPAVDLRIVEQRKTSNERRFRRTITACEVVADLLIIVSSIAIGTKRIGISASAGTSIMEPILFWPQHLVLPLSWFLCSTAGAYSRGNSLLRVRETEQVLRVSAQAFS